VRPGCSSPFSHFSHAVWIFARSGAGLLNVIRRA
jgi:hypothetical protein